MSHQPKDTDKGSDLQSKLAERVKGAIRNFQASQTRDAFGALLEHKAGLLIQDCTALAGNEYKTSDAREAVFLLHHLFHSSRHSEINVAIRPGRSTGSFPNQGPFEDNLISLSSRAAARGKRIRMLFVLDDWVQALADEESARITKDLLLGSAEVALAPKDGAGDFPVGALALFQGTDQSSCSCRFLSGSDRSESRPLIVTYAGGEAAGYSDWFQSLWMSADVRQAKVL